MMTDLSTITAALEAAKDDAALLQRLQGAPTRVAALTKELAAAEAAAARADAAAAKIAQAERKAQLDRYSDFQIVATAKEGSGVLHRGWTITFRGPGWDRGRATHRDDMQVEVRGFRTLANDHGAALRCLIERYPDRIPEEIMALAPGDPWEAINELLYAERIGRVVPKALS